MSLYPERHVTLYADMGLLHAVAGARSRQVVHRFPCN